VKNFLKRILKRNDLASNTTFIQVECNAKRKLPWMREINPIDASEKYGSYWEARYLHRINTNVEICDQFQAHSKIWARELEYGWISRRTLSSDSILDVGSGVSDFPAILSLLTNNVVAVDITDYGKEHTVIAEKFQTSYNWMLADARKLEYSDNTFDCVTCVSVLEHIPDGGDISAMQEMLRVCKVGGRVLISVPYSHSKTLEDFLHPSGLQKYYTFQDVVNLTAASSVNIRDFNFAICGMPEDNKQARFGHPEESSVLLISLEKTA
jgi:ubiquinone/menaquinone biosynthesis C-methylase UbiE